MRSIRFFMLNGACGQCFSMRLKNTLSILYTIFAVTPHGPVTADAQECYEFSARRHFYGSRCSFLFWLLCICSRFAIVERCHRHENSHRSVMKTFLSLKYFRRESIKSLSRKRLSGAHFTKKITFYPRTLCLCSK